jgi:hypothetical protein
MKDKKSKELDLEMVYCTIQMVCGTKVSLKTTWETAMES